MKKQDSYDTLILFDIGGGEVGILRIILTIIFIIDCIALTVIVLMQEGKDQGLGSLSGSMTDTYWSKNKSRSIEGRLVKFTTITAVAYIVISVILNLNF